MTSDVSALWSIVANSHQTLYLVSPTPSKIPYGGFSPVRLQTRLTPRPPSPAPCRHWPSPRPQWLGNHITPRLPDRVDRLTRLPRRSLYATAQWCCMPCSGQDYYYRACVDGVTPFIHVGYN